MSSLAAGTEGAIYRLGDGTVAKVWGHHDVEELARMRLFYQDVAAAGPPFATPEILSVETVRGTAVTVERELPGVQLRKLLSPDDRQVPPEAEECLLTVLRELAAIEGTAPMRRLPVLGEKAALWEGHRDFVTGLVALVERRVPAHAGLFRRRVRGFDRTYERLLGRLAALQVSGHSVIHGDLFPENILVDQDLRPTAVLDFGFLSTAGDPRFDAAMSAAIFDMYGPYDGRSPAGSPRGYRVSSATPRTSCSSTARRTRSPPAPSSATTAATATSPGAPPCSTIRPSPRS